MTDSTEQQLVEARAEIERLTALLPPLPADGQVWRVGSKCPSNLYAHADGLAPKGEPVGVMRSAELAAHVVRAVNAAPHENAQTATEATGDAEASAGAEGGRDDLRALLALKAAAFRWTASRRPTDGSDLVAPIVLAVLVEVAKQLPLAEMTAALDQPASPT